MGSFGSAAPRPASGGKHLYFLWPVSTVGSFFRRPEWLRLASVPRRTLALPALNLEQAIILREPLRARHRTHLNLSRSGRDRQIGQKRILRLARARRNDGPVPGLAGTVDHRKRFGDGPDLVHLDEHRVRGPFLNPAIQPRN